MAWYTGITDFFRGAFGEDEDEKRRRKEREAREAAQRRNAQQQKPQQNNRTNQNRNVQQFFGEPDKKQRQPSEQLKKPPLQQNKPTPQAPRVQVPAYQGGFKGVMERVGDQFEANSPQDQAKRQAAGQPKRYEDEEKDNFAKRNLTPKGLAKNVAHVAQDTAAMVPTAIVSAQEAGRRKANAARTNTLASLKQMSYDERKRRIEEARRNDKDGLGLVLEGMGIDPNDPSDAKIDRALSQLQSEKATTYKPQSPWERFFFGSGKELQSYQQRSEGIEKETGIPSVVAGLGLLGLDWSPGGGGAKGLAEEVAKSKSATKITEMLTKAGFEDLDDELVERLSKTKAAQEVQEALDDFMRRKNPPEPPVSKEVDEVVDDVRQTAKDPDAPPYQRKQAEEELARRNAAEQVADDPLAKPAFQHRQDIADVIRREEDNFTRYVTENPQLTRQQLEAAREAAQERTTKLVDELRQSRQAGLEAVEGQSKKLDDTIQQQADVNAEAAAKREAATAPALDGAANTTATTPNAPEMVANDAYQRFNDEAGLTSGSRDVSYLDAQQELEQIAGNKTLDDLTGRQALRVPAQITEKTQGKAASAVTNVAGKGTGRLLTSQNPVLNTLGQLLYGLNKKSTLSNEGKALVEQVTGRRGGIGNLRDDVVANLEQPLRQLDDNSYFAVKEKVFKAFELYNNGQLDESLALIKSFSPEERAYFDGIRRLNILRNNLNREILSLDKIDEYANGMHMPRIYDQAAFAKEFDEDAIEAFALSQNRTLDLNPAKRRKQLEEISEELRQQMLRDPAQASVIRTEIALHNKAVSDYAASVAHLPGAVSDKPARGFLEIPDSPRYGNVAGKYVRKDLAEPMLSGDLRVKSDNYRAVNRLLDGYQASVFGKIENGLRKVLTVYNPATRLGNRGANLTQGALAGFNLPEMAASQQHFINVLKKGGDEWTRLARTFGAIDDNQALARFSGVISEPGSKTLRRASDSYTDIDTAAKVAMFKWRIQKGATPEEAARFVNRALPNIGNSGEIYSFFSRLPILGVPFRAIQPEVLRSVSSSAARNTLPFIIAMATYTTFQNMTWEGVPEEERKQIQERFGAGQTPFAGINKFFGEKGIPTDKVLPSSWSFNAGALFGEDPETGDQRVVDVDPRRLMGIYSINLGGDSPADSVIDQALKASPASIPTVYDDGDWRFAPQNIVGSRLFQPLYQAAIDRDFRGKSVQDPEGKIYNADGTIDLKYMNPETGKPEAKRDLGRLRDFLIRSYVPQVNDAANIQDARAGRENFYGQEMNVPQAVGRFFGLKGEEFSDKRLQKMKETEEYFNEKAEIDEQVKGMSAAAAEAYKRLTGYYKLRDQKVPNEFEPGEMRDKKAPQYDFSEDKWKEYAAHPELYQLMVDKKKREAARDGKPIQPEFDERLSEAFRKQLIQNKMVAPGDDAELDQRMYSQPEWDYYQQLKDDYDAKAKEYYPESDDEYVDELVKNQDGKFPTKPDILKQYSAAYKQYSDGQREKPLFTDEMKAAKEAYNRETLNWTNEARKKRGLPAITWEVWNNPTFGFDESPSGFGFGFGRGGGGGRDNDVNLLGELTNFTKGLDRMDTIEAEAMPQLAKLLANLQAGSGGGRKKPPLGASAKGR